MALAYLGLGSNIGDRQKYIADAIHLLSECATIERVSTIIETDPVGGPSQGKYLNAVLKARTTLSAHTLLDKIQHIEKTLGRTRNGIINAPRTIDIDILLYDDKTICDEHLSIPHPRMKERAFVMEPLKEIDPALAHTLAEESA